MVSPAFNRVFLLESFINSWLGAESGKNRNNDLKYPVVSLGWTDAIAVQTTRKPRLEPQDPGKRRTTERES